MWLYVGSFIRQCINYIACEAQSLPAINLASPHGAPVHICIQVILTIFISYIVDTFVSQYRLSEKLRETLKRNQEEKQPQEGLIAFCTKQAQSGLSINVHSLHANGICAYMVWSSM